MAMGADYSFDLIFNESCAPQCNGHNNSFLAGVPWDSYTKRNHRFITIVTETLFTFTILQGRVNFFKVSLNKK